MKRTVLLLAVLVTGAATPALAIDLKEEAKTTVPAVATTQQMSDAEMDKVTAGGAGYTSITLPNGKTVSVGGGGQSWHRTGHGPF